MFISNEFRFQTNVSVDTYKSKSEATACLSKLGANAIGKNKMAFREMFVNVDEFLDLATSGHAFCNLFEYDPNKEYWFEASNGKRFKQLPVYLKGENKGAMKLCFKSDKYFKGGQIVFVLIVLAAGPNGDLIVFLGAAAGCHANKHGHSQQAHQDPIAGFFHQSTGTSIITRVVT